MKLRPLVLQLQFHDILLKSLHDDSLNQEYAWLLVICFIVITAQGKMKGKNASSARGAQSTFQSKKC